MQEEDWFMSFIDYTKAEDGTYILSDCHGKALPLGRMFELAKRCREHLERFKDEAGVQRFNSSMKTIKEERSRQNRLEAEMQRKLNPPVPVLQKPLMLYIMFNSRNGLYKIGYSNDPTKREKTLQSQEPEVELLGAWHGGKKLEYELHKQYASKRVRGEWFNLTQEEANSLVQVLNNMKNGTT